MTGAPEECFPLEQFWLTWHDWNIWLVADESYALFNANPEARLFDKTGNYHKRFATLDEFFQELLLRPTEILYRIQPASTVRRTFPVPFSVAGSDRPAGPAWPHTHTLDLASDEVYLEFAAVKRLLDAATITGYLRWERGIERGQYYVIESVPGGDAFAGALIAKEKRDGHMTCLVLARNAKDIAVEFVRLPEKHLNTIRELRLRV